MDKVSRKKRSQIMASIHSTDTAFERGLRGILWAEGIRYWKCPRGMFGHPDLQIKGAPIVVFFDSCFWHGCEQHLRLPDGNREYWRSKIERNIRRDKAVNEHYSESGWTVVRIWEHDREEVPKIAARIHHQLHQRKVHGVLAGARKCPNKPR